jgi:hypothetical protein
MKKFHFALLLVVTTLLVTGLFVVGHLDDASGQRSLSALTPLVSSASDAGLYVVQNMRQLLVWSVLVTAGVLVLCMASGRNLSFALFLFGILLALLTQFILIDETARIALGSSLGLAGSLDISTNTAIAVGIVGYALAFCLVVVAWRSLTAPRFEEFALHDSKRGWPTFLTLVLIVAVGAVFRTYALNQHFNYFEGELSPYSAGATSLTGMFHANRGSNGPWAPLGLLYYIPIYITTSLFGVNLLALRESSALVGVLTIPLVFLLADKIAGRSAGLFAAALFSLNCLHIGWSRTDIHPHGVTTWPTLLMCFFLLKAAETKKLGWAFATACMMGLSWHQYPSGQSAVAIPLIATGFFFLFNKCAIPLRKSQLAVVVLLGVGLWFLGLPLSYYQADGHMKFLNPFTLTGPRALWGTDGGAASSTFQTAVFVAVKTSKHFWDFVQGVFFKVPYLFHQEWLPAIQPLASRSVPWFVVSLSVTTAAILFAQRKRFETAVLFGWFVAAVLPAILSEHAYPKRLSTVFPFFDTLAGVGCSFLLMYIDRVSFSLFRFATVALLLATLSAYSVYSAFFWFSGRFFGYGYQPELAMAKEIQREITPGTLMVSGLGGGYEVGKFLYLMLDHISAPENRPNLYLSVPNEMLSQLFSRPNISREFVASSLPYLWTKLNKQLDESLAVQQWDKVAFLVLENYHNNPVNAKEIQQISSICPNPAIRRIAPASNDRGWTMVSIALITCPASEMSTQLTIK